MENREGEVIVKVVKRHFTPLFFKFLQALIAIVPVYFGVFLVAQNFGQDVLIGTLSVLTFFIVAGFLIGVLDYILDKIVITQHRIVCIDWKSLLNRQEEEIQIRDIQNIKTLELGVLSQFSIFRFGTLSIESAASQVSILFKDCSDPKGTKELINSQVQLCKKELLDK